MVSCQLHAGLVVLASRVALAPATVVTGLPSVDVRYLPVYKVVAVLSAIKRIICHWGAIEITALATKQLQDWPEQQCRAAVFSKQNLVAILCQVLGKREDAADIDSDCSAGHRHNL